MLSVHRSKEVGVLRICWALAQATIRSFGVHRTRKPRPIVLRFQGVLGGSIWQASRTSVPLIVELHGLYSRQVVVDHAFVGVESVEPRPAKTLAHIRRVGPLEVDVAPHLLER